MAMFKANPLPTGNNGFQTNLAPQPCPAMSANWQVNGDAPLPVMPSNAEAYYTNGAGTGPGLKGTGSQSAGASAQGPNGGTSSSSGSASGTATGSAASASATKKSAAGKVEAGVVAMVVAGLVAAVAAW